MVPKVALDLPLEVAVICFYFTKQEMSIESINAFGNGHGNEMNIYEWTWK